MRLAWLVTLLGSALVLADCLLVTDFGHAPAESDSGGGGGALGGGGSTSVGGAGGTGGGGSCSQAPCSILRSANCPEIVANSSAGLVVADASYFYTADHLTSVVRGFPRKGCSGDSFAVAATSPDVVAVYDGWLYWNTRDDPAELRRCQPSDCNATMETVLTAAGPHDQAGFNGFLVQAGRLLVNRPYGEIAWLQPERSALTIVARDPNFGTPGLQTNGLRSDGSDIAWVRVVYETSTDACQGGAGGAGTYVGCTGGYVLAPADGGSDTVGVDLVSPLNIPVSVARAGDWVYHRAIAGDAFVERTSTSGSVEQLAFGAFASELGSASGFGPQIFVAGDWLYFTAEYLPGHELASKRTLMRLPLGQFDPAAIEQVLDPAQLGLNSDAAPGAFYVEEIAAGHALYWEADSTFWGATIPVEPLGAQ